MKLLEFALLQLWRRRYKNLAVFLVLMFLVAVVASLFLTAGSIRTLLYRTLDDLPDIYLQRVVAGRLTPFEEERIEKIIEIAGVEEVYPRVWGYYYFQPAGLNFTVVGVDPDYPPFSKAVTQLLASRNLPRDGMVVGEGVAKILESHWYRESFNFIRPDGSKVNIKLLGTFSSDTLLNYDTVLLHLSTARKIFGMEEGEVTDVAINISNPEELSTISQKLRYLFPDSRVITREDLKASYQNVFDYKSGVFLGFMIVAFIAFFILVFEKATSISREQTREIAVLKAVGWRVSDILKMKFLESLIVVLLAYWVGIMVAYWWVYILQAPLIGNLFSGFSILKPPFLLEPFWDLSLFVTIFMVTAPLYLAATIIPNWQAAVSDIEEALR
ncbi:MAG: FtsX-like permease family protein [Epsilonproteobacteria bacterium]|nr:ABC transporter permease [Campylobacterota bacterium]NPA56926.1 FtsX-like permease family protein [Campylobacterota bacterium]